MSLLQALKLPVPKYFLPMTSGPAAPVATPAAKPGPSGIATASAPGAAEGADLRAQALHLRTQIEAQRKQKADLLLQLQKAGPQLEILAKAAQGEAKKEVAAKQALVAKKKSETERDLARIEADLEAIGDGGTKREELVAVLARHRAGGSVKEQVESVGLGLHSFNENPLKRDVTTTTTSYENGRATVEKRRDASQVDLHGLTSTQSKEKEVSSANITARTSDEKKTNVSLGGKLSIDETEKTEIELPDGRTSSLENSAASEFSTKGASQTKTVARTNFDGSGSSVTAKKGVERGEGKLTATQETSVTTTSTKGVERTTEKKASGGLIAGDKGVGAGGNVEGGRKITSKGGKQAGVVAGLHANVVCNIGKPSGDPLLYPVTLTVSFGASLAVSGGAGQKKGAKASASLEVKGGVDREMVVTHRLGEKELGLYTQALEAASNGSQVAAAGKEFAIIAAGVKEGWSAARQLWETGSLADGLVNVGDSVKKTQTKTGGIAGKAGGKGVGVGYGVTATRTNSLEAKRNATGGIDATAESEKGEEKKKSGSLSASGIGLSVGKTSVHKTSFGYSITIDPKADPDGRILEALGQCETEQQYARFVGLYKGKVKVTGKMKGRSDSESLDTGVSVAGVDVFSMSEGHGVDEKTKSDADGKLVSKTVSAHANIGGKLGGWADSKNDDAVAEIDENHRAKVTLSTTENDNHNARSRDKRAKAAQEKLAGKGPQTGVLAGLAGGGEEPDSATHDVSGLKLSNKDLKRIGGVACRSLPAWVGLHRRADEIKDLQKAGIEIAKAKGRPEVVAEQLVRFIGGDSVERLETVRRIARGGYRAQTGSAFEFPDSIRGLQEDYDTVTDDGLVDAINKIGAKDQEKAKDECLRLLKVCASLMSEIGACKDFSNTATRAEMIQKLELVRQNLAVSAKGFAHETPQVDRKQLAADGERLANQCRAFSIDQARLVSELFDLKGDDKRFLARDRGDARKLIKKLEDLIYRWRGQWYLLKDNYKAQGLPEQMLTLPGVLPDEKVVDYWDAACGN